VSRDGQESAVSSCTDAVREERRNRLSDVSDEDFIAAWEESCYEVAAMARKLGVSRSAIYRRLDETEGCRLARDVPLDELLQVLRECRGDLQRSARSLAVSSRGLEARLRSAGISDRAQGELFVPGTGA
jgi:two-component system nitrogen regulation response regulator GlnG